MHSNNLASGLRTDALHVAAGRVGDQLVAGKATRPKRGCEGDTVLKLRKLQVVRPDANESESETEIE